MNKHIYLIGFMGTGKSTISKKLAQKLNLHTIEMDAEIERRNSMKISEMFEKHGEPYFRDLETQLLEEIAQTEPCIISCGGGAVLRPENVALMKASGLIVLLDAKPETIYDRVKGSTERPILNNNMSVEFIGELMAKREAVYRQSCDAAVATDDRSPMEIADEILKIYNMEK